LAAAENTHLKMAVTPALHKAPGQYDESMLKGLDVLLQEMAKRDMVAVIYLNNFWQWSGGMAQYMAWLTGEPPFDPDATGDWNGFMQNSAKFYRQPQAQDWYRQLIKQIILRTNSLNGRLYRDDPTIMAWQLANEPRPGSDAEGRPFYAAYKTWIAQTAQYIKSLDERHLVSTGSEGAMGSLRDITLYQDAHGQAGIDYLTLHMWPKNWSWYDAQQAEATYPVALAKSKAYLLEHIQVAKALGKPLVLEEFGLERDQADHRPSATTHYRDRYFNDLFQFMEHQLSGSAALMGTNFWAWGGVGQAQSDDFIWRSGDPFTGDPPQEPQGLNSVFAGDKNTLVILKQHAKRLRSLTP
jgi:mannan endo-1,4-beta-mannosidase